MRVFQGDNIIPGDSRPHTFVEIETDSFLEVALPQIETLDKSTKQNLRAFTRIIRREGKRTKQHYIRMTYRYFNEIELIPNLKLLGEF